MAGFNLKPSENDDSWKSYFACIEQLRKGTTGIKKTLKAARRKPRSKAAAKKRSRPLPSSSPTKKSRSSRRISKLVVIAEIKSDEENEENEPEEEAQSFKADPSTPTKDSLKRDRSEESEIVFMESPILDNKRRRA